MRGGSLGASAGDVLRLFEGRSVTGLDDGELLDRFATRRDEAAFETLVTRLGPMVLGVCRRILTDPHDVEDAFQATFLVLVRRAGSIRDRELVAPWLHGVATRVAARARGEAARRARRQHQGVALDTVAGPSEAESSGRELRGLIDEEIGRLPEHHRRALVLCDVEGLTREEAAARLGWTLNMVRGRLERARGRLRGRLIRRGVSPGGAAWMIAPPVVPPGLLMATTRAALGVSAGRLGLASASAVALSRGVTTMMMVSKWKLGLVVACSAGFVAGGAKMVAAQKPGEALPGTTAEVKVGSEPSDPSKPTPFLPRSAAELAKARIAMARQRYETQKAFYNEGRLTIDRLAGASSSLMEAERDAASTKLGRVEAVRDHHARLTEVLKREKAELEVGRATTADISEVTTALLDAEFALARELQTPEAKGAGEGGGAGQAVESKPAAKTNQPKVQSDANKKRVEMARKAYEAVVRETMDQLVATHQPGVPDHGTQVFSAARAEQLYLWSKRWMEAQDELTTGQEGGEVAGLRAHLARMKGLEAGGILKALRGEVRGPDLTDANLAAQMTEFAPAFMASIQYYRVEAESWQARAGGR